MESINDIINRYPFVRTDRKRDDSSFVSDVLKEQEIVRKQRNAVFLCKSLLQIKTNNISKLSNDEKMEIEVCLRKNFLKHDPNYFGKRNTVFLDLFEY